MLWIPWSYIAGGPVIVYSEGLLVLIALLWDDQSLLADSSLWYRKSSVDRDYWVWPDFIFTYDYENGAYFAQSMSVQDKGDTVALTISEKQGTYTPNLEYYIYKIHAKASGQVSINGQSTAQCSGLNELQNAAGEGWTFGTDIYGTVTDVKVSAGKARNITVHLKTK